MKRRTFITLIGGAVAWSLAARAIARAHAPHLYMNLASDDAEGQSRKH
jgi:hypothetical protein